MIEPAQPTPNAPSAAARRWVVLAGLLLAATHLCGVTPRWWPTPDSAVYLGLGRSIAQGDGYRFNAEVNTRFAPGLPIILAGVHRLCGEGFLTPNLVITACGLATLLLIARTLPHLGASRPTALAVTLATGFSYIFYLNAHRILSDVPFALAFWAMLYCVLRARHGGRGWLAAAGLLVAMAIGLRAPGVLLIVPLGLGLVLQAVRRPRGKHAGAGEGEAAEAKNRQAEPDPKAPSGAMARKTLLGGCLLLVVALVACGALYALVRFAARGEPGYLQHLHVPPGAGPWRYVLRLQAGLAEAPSALAELLTGQDGLWPLALVLLGLMAAGVARWRPDTRRMLAPMLTLYPIGLATTLGAGGMRSRYLLPIAPLLLYAATTGLAWLVERIIRWRRLAPRPSPAGWATWILAGVLLAFNLPKVGRNAFYYSFLSSSPQYYERIREGESGELYRAAELVRQSPADAAGGVEEGWCDVICYLSERRVTALPHGPLSAPADAETLLHFLAEHSDLKFLVLAPRGTPAERERLAERLSEGGWTSPYTGKRLAVYAR